MNYYNLVRLSNVKTLVLLPFATTMLLFGGCASIVSGGSNQSISIKSNPPGARVIVDHQLVGRTPYQAHLYRRSDHTVAIELPGYAPYEVQLIRGVNPWVYGNLGFGGVIGLCVDLGTGAIYKLDPSDIDATLQPKGHSHSHRHLTSLNTDQGQIIVYASEHAAGEKIGQMQRLN